MSSHRIPTPTATVYERRDFERAVELVAHGSIPADHFITRVVPLRDVESAFHTLETGQAMKILVRVEHR